MYYGIKQNTLSAVTKMGKKIANPEIWRNIEQVR